MKKSKSSSKYGDRLSELPDSLIFEIFWLLPVREVVRTTVLSHRWRNLWTTAPYLNFEDCKVEIDADKVRNFVNRALMLWRGTRIERFRLDFGTHLHQSLYSDIDLWLHFATQYELEVLGVELEYSDFILDAAGSMEGMEEEMYWTPECLYSCSSLKRLCLRGCSPLFPMKNVNWNRLVQLQIIDGCGLSEDLINQVLCGSPQLEVFCLDLMENHDDMTIQSSSLKHLFIYKYLYYVLDVRDPCMDTELNICTPNLESLQIKGIPYSKCSMNVPSLIRANLLFDGVLFSRNDIVGEACRQILPTIQHVEQLKLSYWCIKALGLGAVENKNMLPPFLNVEELELNGEYEQIVHLLEIFPKLEMLVLQLEEAMKLFNGKETPKFEASFPDSFLQELRTVTITWVEGEGSIFPLVEILLKYSSKLEKMVFRVRKNSSPSNMALQKLLRMPRSSPTAELIFL